MSVYKYYRYFLYCLILLGLLGFTSASWGHSKRIYPPKIAITETSFNLTRIRVIHMTPRFLFDTLMLESQSNKIPKLYLSGTGENATNNQYGYIDYLYENNTYYVNNIKSKQIETFQLYGSVYQRRVIYRGTSSNVRGIAVNWVTGDVYWADSSYNSILMVPGSGSCEPVSCPVTIIGNDVTDPRDIAIHVNKGLLFWLDSNRLQMADLNGRNMSTLLSNLTAPSSVTVSYPDNRLFWIDVRGDDSVIESCDIQGQGWKFVRLFPGQQIFGLDVFKNIIISVDRSRNSILLFDMDMSEVVEHHNGGNIHGITVVSGQKQHRTKGLKTKSFRSRTTTLDQGVLFVASSTGISVMRKYFAEVFSNDHMMPLFNVDDVMAMTSDVRSNYIYYYRNKPSAKIERTTLKCFFKHSPSCSEKTDIISLVVGNVESLAIDWVVKNLYWTDSRTRQIMVSRDDGRFPLVLIDDVAEPRAVAVDPINRYLFWSDVYRDKMKFVAPKIERTDLDGSMRKEIYLCKYGPLGLAVDFETNRLYWSDGPDLCSGDFEGLERRPCEHLQNLRRNIRTIDVMADYVLWTDTVIGGLFAADTMSQSGSKFHIVGSSQSRKPFLDVVYHHISRQPVKKNMCSTNNGGCEHLCLPNLYPEGRRCACALGYFLQVDGSCSSVPLEELFLLFADQRLGNIYQSSLLLNLVSVVPFQTMRAPADVAFDPVENMVYWTDYWFQTINRGHVNGSWQEVIYSHMDVVPARLALDWYSRLLYFTDYSSGSINVLSLQNWSTKTLIKQWDIRVNDVTVYPARGMMFFTAQITTIISKTTNTSETMSESTTAGAVYSAYMDGTNANPIAWGLANPTGITANDDCVYWVDAAVNTIERVTIGDWNYTLLLQLPLLEDNEPMDVAVARDYVYWTEKGARTLKRMSLKQDGAMPENYGTSRFFKMIGLDVIEERSQIHAENSSCMGDNSDCYHMCLPTPDGAECACPVEFSYGPHCYKNMRKFNERKKFMKANFCIVPDVRNGTTVNVKPGSFVCPGFRLRITCDPGFKLTSQWTWIHHEKGVSVPQSLEEMDCTEGGRWNKEVQCQWDMHYFINGTWSRGFTVLRQSVDFLVHPGIYVLDVICIGGGGGGFDPGLVEFKDVLKAGDGGNTSFGRYLHSSGGKGGTLKKGGAGGFGFTLYGGDGGDSNVCHGGGAAGQSWDPGHCVLPSTTCLFCGAGAAPVDCPQCSGQQGSRAAADDSDTSGNGGLARATNTSADSSKDSPVLTKADSRQNKQIIKSYPERKGFSRMKRRRRRRKNGRQVAKGSKSRNKINSTDVSQSKESDSATRNTFYGRYDQRQHKLNKDAEKMKSSLKGGCSGPWATKRAGLRAGNYGGGASGRNGGWGGGGGGFSRLLVDVKPGEIIRVRVGKSGVPSVGSAGDGVVVIAWGWSVETFLGFDKEWESNIEKCLGLSESE